MRLPQHKVQFSSNSSIFDTLYREISNFWYFSHFLSSRRPPNILEQFEAATVNSVNRVRCHLMIGHWTLSRSHISPDKRRRKNFFPYHQIIRLSITEDLETSEISTPGWPSHVSPLAPSQTRLKNKSNLKFAIFLGSATCQKSDKNSQQRNLKASW